MPLSMMVRPARTWVKYGVDANHLPYFVSIWCYVAYVVFIFKRHRAVKAYVINSVTEERKLGNNHVPTLSVEAMSGGVFRMYVGGRTSFEIDAVDRCS